jgi:hypothetical protein
MRAKNTTTIIYVQIFAALTITFTIRDTRASTTRTRLALFVAAVCAVIVAITLHVMSVICNKSSIDAWMAWAGSLGSKLVTPALALYSFLGKRSEAKKKKTTDVESAPNLEPSPDRSSGVEPSSSHHSAQLVERRARSY